MNRTHTIAVLAFLALTTPALAGPTILNVELALAEDLGPETVYERVLNLEGEKGTLATYMHERPEVPLTDFTLRPDESATLKRLLEALKTLPAGVTTPETGPVRRTRARVEATIDRAGIQRAYIFQTQLGSYGEYPQMAPLIEALNKVMNRVEREAMGLRGDDRPLGYEENDETLDLEALTKTYLEFLYTDTLGVMAMGSVAEKRFLLKDQGWRTASDLTEYFMNHDHPIGETLADGLMDTYSTANSDPLFQALDRTELGARETETIRKAMADSLETLPARVMTTGGRLHIRRTPNWGPVFAKLPHDAHVAVLESRVGRGGLWHKIRMGSGKVGYVHRFWLLIETPISFEGKLHKEDGELQIESGRSLFGVGKEGQLAPRHLEGLVGKNLLIEGLLREIGDRSWIEVYDVTIVDEDPDPTDGEGVIQHMEKN